MRVDHDAELMSFNGVARALRVPETTVRMAYIAGLMPSPDERSGRNPLWTLQTARQWAAGLDLTIFEDFEERT